MVSKKWLASVKKRLDDLDKSKSAYVFVWLEGQDRPLGYVRGFCSSCLLKNLMTEVGRLAEEGKIPKGCDTEQ